jgi:ABC-type spermidine/putrescine transport system permease subunit II
VLTTRFDYRLLEAAADLRASRWRVFWDIQTPLLRPAVIGAGIFSLLVSFNEGQRAIFLHGNATTLPIWNWIMASSEQSQVPIIFCLEMIILAVAMPLLAATFWMVTVRLDKN